MSKTPARDLLVGRDRWFFFELGQVLEEEIVPPADEPEPEAGDEDEDFVDELDLLDPVERARAFVHAAAPPRLPHRLKGTPTMKLEDILARAKVILRQELRTVGATHAAGGIYKVLGFQGSLVRLSREGDHAKLTTLASYLAPYGTLEETILYLVTAAMPQGMTERELDAPLSSWPADDRAFAVTMLLGAEKLVREKRGDAYHLVLPAPKVTLEEARRTALAAGVPAELVEETIASARAPQGWGFFCGAWHAQIRAAGARAGDLLRAVHEAAQ